jgi:hypothetical protein
MKLPTLLLLASLMIMMGVCSLLDWNIAAAMLLGAFSGGMIFEFVMPIVQKRFFYPKIDESIVVIETPQKETIIERLTIKTG